MLYIYIYYFILSCQSLHRGFSTCSRTLRYFVRWGGVGIVDSSTSTSAPQVKPIHTNQPATQPTNKCLRIKSIICIVYWNFSQLKGGNVHYQKKANSLTHFFLYKTGTGLSLPHTWTVTAPELQHAWATEHLVHKWPHRKSTGKNLQNTASRPTNNSTGEVENGD